MTDWDKHLRGSAPMLGAYAKKAYEDGMKMPPPDVREYAETLRKLREQIDGFLAAVERAEADA